MINIPLHDKSRFLKILGGRTTFPKSLGADVDIFQLIQKGFPFEAIEVLIKRDKIASHEIKNFIPERTLVRRRKEKRLNAEESDAIARLAMIIDFAEEVFGDPAKAKVWLRRPNRAMKDYKPIDLLVTDYGARVVETILGRIQHGVYS